MVAVEKCSVHFFNRLLYPREDDAEIILQSYSAAGKRWKSFCISVQKWGLFILNASRQLVFTAENQTGWQKRVSGTVQRQTSFHPTGNSPPRGLHLLHVYFISIPEAFFAHLTLNSYDLFTHGYKSLQLSLLIKCIFSIGMTRSEVLFGKKRKEMKHNQVEIGAQGHELSSHINSN